MNTVREVARLLVDTVWPRCLCCGRRRAPKTPCVCSACGVLA